MKLFETLTNANDNNSYAMFNTKLNQIVSRGLTSDMIDYLLYKKNKVKDENLKVIQNPSDDEITMNDDGSLVFKNDYSPQFLGFNY